MDTIRANKAELLRSRDMTVPEMFKVIGIEFRYRLNAGIGGACRWKKLSELIVYLTSGGGTNTWLDWELACIRAAALGIGPHTSEHPTPAYTASLEAARSFVWDVLPGFWVSSGTCALTGHASIGPDYNGPHGERLHREWPLNVPGERETWDEDLAPGGDQARECRAILACAVRALLYKNERG
jgi:hypothetical protein